MLVGTGLKNRPPTFKIHNHRVPIVNSFKYLGLIIDSSFTFFDHLLYLKAIVTTYSLNVNKVSASRVSPEMLRH